MVNDKRDFISKLSIKELVELIEKLLPTMGIKSVKRNSNNSVEAIIDAGKAGSFTNCYMLFSEPLSRGYSQIEVMADVVNRRLNSGCSKTYIVSSGSISKGFELELEHRMSKKNSLMYWQIDDLLSSIEENYPDYWRHSDQALISYETNFEERVNDSFEIKKLVEYKAAYQKLLSIFIEPNLFLRTEDKQSTKKAFTKIHLERLIDENKRLLILHGDPGTGKTRLLNEIGRLLIKRNSRLSGNRFLPTFIDSVNLRDSFNDQDEVDIYSLLMDVKLKEYFNGQNLDSLLENYQLVILIDSIDEFEVKYRDKIIDKLELLMNKGVIIFIGTRSNTLDNLFKGSASINVKDVHIQKFNDEQVVKFASSVMSIVN